MIGCTINRALWALVHHNECNPQVNELSATINQQVNGGRDGRG
jgi:hypothetical protein